MLPVFAPIVINVHTRIARSSIFAILSTASANGTNVSNATSFVMSMDEKNVSEMNVSTSPRAVSTCSSSFAPMMRNTPTRCSPHTTSMRQISCAMVLTCTYSR